MTFETTVLSLSLEGEGAAKRWVRVNPSQLCTPSSEAFGPTFSLKGEGQLQEVSG